MFGLGAQEMLLLLILGVFLIGLPVAVVFRVLYLVRRRGGSRIAELEAENRGLREKLDER
jgi:hypothetical protein